MKYARQIGLTLFLAGFALFLVSFFVESYRLEGKMVEARISDAQKRDILHGYLTDIYSKKYATSFGFVKQLHEIFNEINEDQRQKYRISQGEINQILQEANLTAFSFADIEGRFTGEDGNFKYSSLTSYGSWIEGKAYADPADLENDLQVIAANIEAYEIIGKKGFDRYQVKDLTYSLTRDASFGPVKEMPWAFILATYGLCILGALLFFMSKADEIPGIKNNNIFRRAMTSRGWLGIFTGTFLILFYILLYYYPEHMTSWIIMVDPISVLLNGNEAGRFFLYGLLYTITVFTMGIRMMIKYRGNNYQLIRTGSVIFFQTAFDFLIPEILIRLNKPYFDFKNIWPLDYDFFFDNELNTLIESGGLGIFMLGWGIALIVIAVPVMVYFFGKRWYCSWVCGCGGLAETLGDPYRQLSNKTLGAWKIERWMIHGVLVFAVVMTAGVLYTFWTGNSQVLGINSYSLRETYGFWIGAGFAGVVGTGFYPLMGNRVWCRFGCPLAAYLGLVQRFKSRFRITTNGGQCISCGNCSTYCEMGIDVRWYAQRGQNIVRSSCVGCGVCSAVCPRGVLKLENGDEGTRFNISSKVG
jgi:Pyruvate/2-oxoacid:ferredoxin oxidoreductase delta subunit